MIPRHRQPEDNIDSWLMSYADMITLLLCFFIIFVSVSEPKKDKMSAIAQGLHDRFGSVELATPFQGVFRSLQNVVEGHHLLKDISVEKTEDSIAMDIAASTLFKEHTAELSPDTMPVLLDMAAAIKNIDFLDYRIIVEGHTSDEQAGNPLYPTNWELSGARATRIVRFLIDQGVKPERLVAAAYGDSRPKVPNLDSHGKPIPANRDQNQRILIKIERPL